MARTSTTAPATLADRLALARRARFVGRAAELARWQRMLSGEAEPVWFLHGPGGIGKTTLLAELARRAEAAGRIAVEIDARHLAASPAGWHQALRVALSVEQAEPLPPAGSVLLVDTFETIAGLEGWLRDEELLRYPADVRVVLAGRTPADPAWRLDPGWSSVAAVTRLAPWGEAEAREYLASRLAGSPGGEAVTAAMVERGAGVPLLLALLVDAHRRGEDLPAPGGTDVGLHGTLVRELLERFARELSDPVLRAALDVLTVARSVTVPMLAETVDAAAAADTYDWLAGLPFVQAGEAGLQMHDVVREAFAAAWRARDPVAIDRAGLKVQQYLARRAPLVGRDEAVRQLKDWIFVLRFTDAGHVTDYRHIEAYRLGGLERDGDAVVALVRRRLGEGMAERIAHWVRERPRDFLLARHRDGGLRGVVLALEMTEIAPAAMAADPAVAKAWAYVQRKRAPCPGGSACCIRLTLDAELDTLPNPTATLGGGGWLMERSLLDPRAEWNVAFSHNVEVMDRVWPNMRRLNWATREPALDEVVDGRLHGAYVRDYITEPIAPEWRPPAQGPDRPPLPGADEFAQAVREALRQYGRDEALATSPLRRCAWLGGGDGAPAGIDALREALAAAVQALARHPADQKFHRALQRTWLTPGAKQEAVAAELDLPFNTYRYHLARGAERVAQALWQAEQLARRG
jgi:hypothetical protein